MLPYTRDLVFSSNGGIGRRARLRIWYRKVCGFDPLFEHSFFEEPLKTAAPVRPRP